MSEWKGIEAEARSAAKAGVEGWDGAGDYGHMRAMRNFARRCIAHGLRLAVASGPIHWSEWLAWSIFRDTWFADAIERGEVEV